MAETCNHDKGIDWRAELNETWMKTMEYRLQSHRLQNHGKRNGTQQLATIFKVLPTIRQVNAEAFEPQFISFGPYHHGKHRLKSMEEHKWRYLNKFLARNPNKRLRDYAYKIKSVVGRARSCYADEVLIEDDDFVEMLILDGSMMVELLMMRQEPPPQDRDFDPVVDTMWALPLIVYDMLKLENQVPFFVLDCLYEIVIDVGKSEENISDSADQLPIMPLSELVFSFISQNIFDEHIILAKPSPEEEIHHLFHFFHYCIAQDQPAAKSSTKNRRRLCYSCRRSTQRGLSSLKHKFLGAVSRKSTTTRLVQPDSDEESAHPIRSVESIPTAQELTESGVRFNKKKKGGFLEVTFSGGVMGMIPLVIYEETNILFHNLIAFEHCYPYVGRHVTGYCVFLDYLIHTPADVGVLRRKGVVENKLGSDKEVAILINSLCQHVAAGDHPLSELFVQVDRYCHSSWPRWRARLAREYFGNPWAIISLVAAVILLFLTLVQTAFAIIPYFWPPKS